MNCKKCLELQQITGNKASRCIEHGLSTLLRRYEKLEKEKEKALLRELRRNK